MLAIVGLKPPYLLASFIKVTPPAEPDEQPTCDILDDPEIDSPQNCDQYESGYQTENIAKEEIATIWVVST